MALLARSQFESHNLACPFSGSWIFLEELHIRRWRDIEWREAQFGQLRVLDIGCCVNLEISLILRLIQENQHLEILKLEDITLTSSTSLPQSNTPVTLSHLKDLTLSKLVLADSSKVNADPHHPTLHILRHIRFPSCTKFTLHTSIRSGSTVDPEDLQSLLPSPLDLLAHPSPNDPQTSHTTRGYLTATFWSHGLVLTSYHEPGFEYKYDVQLNVTPRSIARRWLKSALEDRPGVTLQGFELQVEIEERSDIDEVVTFQGSEAVTRLSVIPSVHLRGEMGKRLLQILATPCTSASGATVMAFPRLLMVEFKRWEGQGEAVLEMIRNRFGTPGVEAHRPHCINIKYGYRYGYAEFLWDSLDEIREFNDTMKEIHFGPIDSWPSWSPRPGSPESGWPPSDEDGSNSVRPQTVQSYDSEEE